MTIITHEINNKKIVEIQSENLVITNLYNGSDLVGTMYFDGFDVFVLDQKNIVSDFFDLKTKMAGEILQKCSNFRLRLVIIGDFENVESKALRDFIYESNKGRLVNFVETLDVALKKFR